MASILIVEYDPIIAQDIYLMLEKNGHNVLDVCHKVSKAINRLSKGGIDTAILYLPCLRRFGYQY